jgi:hypothetical protein
MQVFEDRDPVENSKPSSFGDPNGQAGRRPVAGPGNPAGSPSVFSSHRRAAFAPAKTTAAHLVLLVAVNVGMLMPMADAHGVKPIPWRFPALMLGAGRDAPS